MDFGYPGQNPGSTFVIRGTENTTKTVPPACMARSWSAASRASPVNRIYMPYGVGSDGIIQINDLTKVLPPPYGSGVYANPASSHRRRAPARQIGVVYMPGAEGGHSAIADLRNPFEAVRQLHEQQRSEHLAVSSEETDKPAAPDRHTSCTCSILRINRSGRQTSAEQHPWPISTVTVDDFLRAPQLSVRVGPLRCSSLGREFQDPTTADCSPVLVRRRYSRHRIRDPTIPRKVAHFIAPVNKVHAAELRGHQRRHRYTALDVSCDNTDVDNRGLRYCGDRVGGGSISCG